MNKGHRLGQTTDMHATPWDDELQQTGLERNATEEGTPHTTPRTCAALVGLHRCVGFERGADVLMYWQMILLQTNEKQPERSEHKQRSDR